MADLTIGAVDSGVLTTKFDLQLTLTTAADGLGLSGLWLYSEDLFDKTTVESFAQRFVRVPSRSPTIRPGRSAISIC